MTPFLAALNKLCAAEYANSDRKDYDREEKSCMTTFIALRLWSLESIETLKRRPLIIVRRLLLTNDEYPIRSVF